MTTTINTHERAAELLEIKEKMLELLDEAQAIVYGTSEEQRAKSYWWAHIRCALDNEHSYLGGSMITMQETIEKLEAADDDEEEDDRE